MDNPAELKQRNVKAYMHAYHEGWSPLGFVDRDERQHEIDTIKAKTESPRQIAWRNQLFGKDPVEGLPEDLIAAGQQWDAAERQWDAARRQLTAAAERYLPLLIEFHAKHCGCPWTPENDNIFDFMPEAF